MGTKAKGWRRAVEGRARVSRGWGVCITAYIHPCRCGAFLLLIMCHKQQSTAEDPC